MSNTFAIANILAKASLAVLDNQLGVLNSLYRAPEEEFSKKVNGYAVGETISIRRPHDPRPRRGEVAVIKDVIEGKVALTVDQVVGHDFKLGNVERTLNVPDLTERIVKPAIINIVNDIARDVFSEMYAGFYNWVGTPGQRLVNFDGFSKGPERMDEMCIPDDNRFAFLSPNDNWGMVGSQTVLNNGSMVSGAFHKGSLGEVAGCTVFKSGIVPTHVAGTRTNTTPLVDGNQSVTYDAAKNTWSQSLLLKGAGNAVTYKKGDVFTIGAVKMVNPKTKQSTGIDQQFVVLEDVTTSGGGAVTLTISPPIITEGPHQTVDAAALDNAAITNLGTASASYRQNMCYHKNAMALAIVPMEMPAAAESIGSRQSHKGISVRVIPGWDFITNQESWRLDVLYGRRLIDPRLGTRLSGTALS